MKAQESAQRDYIQSVASSTPSTSAEITRLVDLRDQGAITDDEFAALKAKAMT